LMICCTMNNSIYQAIICKEFHLAVDTFSYVIYNNKKRVLPKTEPCSTPEMTLQGEENEQFTITY